MPTEDGTIDGTETEYVRGRVVSGLCRASCIWPSFPRQLSPAFQSGAPPFGLSGIRSSGESSGFGSRENSYRSCMSSLFYCQSWFCKSFKMAPHHHLRASFIANPVLFSFPAVASIPVRKEARIGFATSKTPSSLATQVDAARQQPESGFWRAFKAGTVGARNRERGEQRSVVGSDETLMTSERKRALVFAGLVGPFFAFAFASQH
jgi:hypothetical protein